MLSRIGTSSGGIIFCLVVLLHASHTHSWMVQHDNSVCMLMTFNATILLEEDGLTIPTFIPLNALTDGSVCGKSFSIFHLEYDIDDDHEVTLSFVFNKTEHYVYDDDDWMLSKIETELYNMNTSTSYIQSTASDFEEFFTPIGQYMQCDSHLQIPDISLTFTEIEVMQPFASSEDPGEGHKCEADREPDDSNTVLIVICVLAGMAVAVITCCVCNRMHRRRHNRYRRSKNYVR